GVVSFQSIAIGPKTSYGGSPSYLRGRPLVLTINRESPVNANNRFAATFQYHLEIRPLFIILRWGVDGRHEPPRADIYLRRADDAGSSAVIFHLPATQAERRVLSLPIRELSGLSRLSLQAVDRRGAPANFAAWEGVDAPSRGDESKAVILDLVPNTFAAQFRSLIPKLDSFLQEVGLSEEERQKLLAVTIVDVQQPGNRYTEGRIEMDSSNTLESAADRFFHEFGHHFAAVIAPDAPPGVGGGREGHEISTPTRAWDEGRAEFMARVFCRQLGLPAPATANEDLNQGDNACREKVIYQALTEYYENRAIFPTAADALRHFCAVHARSTRVRRRPPRTIEEFIASERQEAANDHNRLRAIDDLEARYRFGAPAAP
ncbi:MAG: hypothetical protein N3A66_00930, partial [Planctomycetota bacterium]|nr:hypothetical protein [Planctomycetota bacterium]